jgi:hypothetical protein
MSQHTHKTRPKVSPPPWVWCRIVRASTLLTPMQKLVWDEERGLSNGRGATIGAGPLGLRLGTSRETIERARRDLVVFGMLKKLDLGRGRPAAWFPVLPADCHPAQGRRRLTDDEVQAYGSVLDACIKARKGESGVTGDTTNAPNQGADFPGSAATLASSVTPLGSRNSLCGQVFSEPYGGTRGDRGERGALRTTYPGGTTPLRAVGHPTDQGDYETVERLALQEDT